VLSPLFDAGLLGAPTAILALWRAAERLSEVAPWHGDATLVDVVCPGETKLHAASRGADGLPAVPIGKGSLSGGLTAIGSYRFRQNDVDFDVARAGATILALPDANLGQRFVGQAPDPAETAVRLNACGVNALIAGAFRPRGRKDAA
jgi:hypothetical protein